MLRSRVLAVVIALALLNPMIGVAYGEEALRIGVLTTLTGNWAGVGHNVVQGVTLAAEEINSGGGILGRTLEIEVQDTDEELSGAKILSSYRFLRTKGFTLFVGPTGVPGSQSLGPVAAKDPVVVVTSAALTPFERFGANLFNVIGDSEITTRSAARWSYARGARRAAVLRSEQPWEFSQGEYFRDEFTALGGEISAFEESPATESEFRLQAVRIAKAQPDTVFLAVFNQVASAAKALSKIGLGSSRVLALLDDAHLAAADGTLEESVFFLFEGPSPEFIERYRRRFSEAPGYASDYSYDAVMAYAAALKLSGTEEPAKLQEAMRAVQFKASLGRDLRFTAQRFVERGVKRYAVRQGKIVPEPDNQ